jgi:lipopolysaccharide transport system permease protein
LPDAYRSWLALSPLTFPIEGLRDSMIRGRAPDLRNLAVYSLVAASTYAAGLHWFQRTRRGFADVL